MHLIREDQPIPFDHSVVRSYTVPAFDPSAVRLECKTEIISVDSWGDTGPFIETIPGRSEAKVFDASGNLLFAGSPEVAYLGTQGGGRFLELVPNEPTFVESRKEYRSRIRAQAKRDAEEDAEYWRD